MQYHFHSILNRFRRKRGIIESFLIATAMLYAIPTLAATPPGGITLHAAPRNIDIDFFYHGGKVKINGEVENDVDIVVKVSLLDKDQVLKKKGKVAGFLWMNVGDITFKHTPGLYYIFSTGILEQILSETERNMHNLGYSALARHIAVEPVEGESEKQVWLNEFIKLKESQRLFNNSENGIKTTNSGNNRKSFELEMEWPYQAMPDNYIITAYAIRNSRVIGKATSNIDVKQVGIVKSLTSMAKGNAALYGIISIGVALLAGFATGIIFQKGGKSK